MNNTAGRRREDERRTGQLEQRTLRPSHKEIIHHCHGGPANGTRTRHHMATLCFTPALAIAHIQRRGRPSRAHRRAAVNARAAAADTPEEARAQKEQLAAMRREVQVKAMRPSQANVVNAIVDLAQQEFGLAGTHRRIRARASDDAAKGIATTRRAERCPRQ